MYKHIVATWSIEFGPIVLFFLSLSYFGSNDEGFLTATAIFTVATIISLFGSYIYEKRIAWFALMAGIIVVCFGLLTLSFKEPIIFILKDTFYNGTFGLALLIGAFFGKPLLQPLFLSLADMNKKGWMKLSIRWGVFFALLAITNEITWRFFSQEDWVNYKFWSTVITCVFGFYQITLSRKYRNPNATKWGLRKESAYL